MPSAVFFPGEMHRFLRILWKRLLAEGQIAYGACWAAWDFEADPTLNAWKQAYSAFYANPLF